jgi:arylsulfatase
MDRRKFLKSATAAGSAGLAGFPAAPFTGASGETQPRTGERAPARRANDSNRPNIVVILADDMGFSDVGAYGSEIDTPNIDRLAEDGLRFTQCYNTARCAPTRASLLTGLYPHEAGVGSIRVGNDLGVPGYRGFLRSDTATIPEVLSDAGYRTMMAGKWHLGWRDEGAPTQRGFQRFYGTRGYVDSYFTVVPNTAVRLDGDVVLPPTQSPVNHLRPEEDWYTTDAYTDYGLHFMDEALRHDSPFFLYMAYNAPHFPLHAKREDLEKYRGRYDAGYVEIRRQRYRRLVDMGIIEDQWPLSPHDSPDWTSLTDREQDEMDLKMALYAGIVDRLDQNVGRIVDKLEEEGELDNTLILFLSDNGGTSEGGLFGINDDAHVENYEAWARKGGWSSSYGQGWANVSNTPFRLYKKYTHEGGVSTPLIAHWPSGIEARGELRHQRSHVVDVMATCVDVVEGAEYPPMRGGRAVQPLRGESLVPAFADEGTGHERLYWEHEGNRAVRHGDWKLVAAHGTPWSLYDMAEDRPEATAQSSADPERVKRLTRDYRQWAQNSSVLPWNQAKKRYKANSG